MRIPEHIVEQITRQTDIVEIIGEAVRLRKRGRNYIGLCPFHNEKTPSFNVLPERGIFKCFGCGKGGNAAIFLRDYQKISYPDALKELAKRANIPLPEENDSEAAAEYSRHDAAYAALRAAGNFYYRQLFSEQGARALAYLRERGFGEEVIKIFGLGYAPDDFSATSAELLDQGFSDEALLDAGLLVKNEEKGRVYDRFRGRLTFPIQNATGRVIGFGARRLTEDRSQPKYVNSPQTLAYDKSQALYGLFQAKDAIRRREEAILTEGYADLISAYQAGFQNVVASSGTALTREQLRSLARYCKRLTIVYDGDAAGIHAALRGLDLAVEEDFEVAIATLPEGDDPDSLIRREGAEAFQRCLDGAQSLVRFKCENARAAGKLDDPAGQAEAVRDVIETVAKVPDALKRDFMIRDVALRFALNEHDLYRELNAAMRRKQTRRIERAQAPSDDSAAESSADESAPIQRQRALRLEAEARQGESVSAASEELLPEEIEILRAALSHAGAVGYMAQTLGVVAASFVTDVGKRLFERVGEASAQNREPLQWLLASDNLADDEKSLIIELAIRKETPSERWAEFGAEAREDIARVLSDCALQLQERRKEQERKSLAEALKRAHDHNEGIERELELLKSMQIVDAEIRRLQAERGGEAVLP